MSLIIYNLKNIFFEQPSLISLKFKLYMHNSFDMNDKLIGIIGSRGVGEWEDYYCFQRNALPKKHLVDWQKRGHLWC